MALLSKVVVNATECGFSPLNNEMEIMSSTSQTYIADRPAELHGSWDDVWSKYQSERNGEYHINARVYAIQEYGRTRYKVDVYKNGRCLREGISGSFYTETSSNGRTCDNYVIFTYNGDKYKVKIFR